MTDTPPDRQPRRIARQQSGLVYAPVEKSSHIGGHGFGSLGALDINARRLAFDMPVPVDNVIEILAVDDKAAHRRHRFAGYGVGIDIKQNDFGAVRSSEIGNLPRSVTRKPGIGARKTHGEDRENDGVEENHVAEIYLWPLPTLLSREAILSRSFFPVQFIIEDTGHRGTVNKVIKKAIPAVPKRDSSSDTELPAAFSEYKNATGTIIAAKKAQIMSRFANILIIKMLTTIETAATPAAIT